MSTNVKNANKVDEKLNQAILLANQDDMSEFSVIFEQTHKLAAYVIGQKISETQDVDDILQEVYIKVYKNINSLRNVEAFKSWFMQIVTNTTLDYIKKHHSGRVATPVDILEKDNKVILSEDKLNIPEDSVLNEEFNQKMHSAISEMPENQRKTILALYFSDLSVKEFSDLTGTSQNTIRRRLFDAKKTLKKKLNDMQYELRTFFGVFRFRWASLMHNVANAGINCVIFLLIVSQVFGGSKNQKTSSKIETLSQVTKIEPIEKTPILEKPEVQKNVLKIIPVNSVVVEEKAKVSPSPIQESDKNFPTNNVKVKPTVILKRKDMGKQKPSIIQDSKIDTNKNNTDTDANALKSKNSVITSHSKIAIVSSIHYQEDQSVDSSALLNDVWLLSGKSFRLADSTISGFENVDFSKIGNYIIGININENGIISKNKIAIKIVPNALIILNVKNSKLEYKAGTTISQEEIIKECGASALTSNKSVVINIVNYKEIDFSKPGIYVAHMACFEKQKKVSGEKIVVITVK